MHHIRNQSQVQPLAQVDYHCSPLRLVVSHSYHQKHNIYFAIVVNRIDKLRFCRQIQNLFSDNHHLD